MRNFNLKLCRTTVAVFLVFMGMFASTALETHAEMNQTHPYSQDFDLTENEINETADAQEQLDSALRANYLELHAIDPHAQHLLSFIIEIPLNSHSCKPSLRPPRL